MVATADKKKQPASKVAKKAASSGNLKVLVVEDFKTMRKAVVKVLDSLNMKVLEASNGIEALKVLDSESVDIVFRTALELGAEIEGQPSQEDENFYGGYFRDLDGHLLAIFCATGD